MKHILVATILALSSEVQASTLDDVPLFWLMTGNSPTYQQAAQQAQRAFFLQTGFTPQFDQWQGATTNKAQTATMQYIDNNTWFSSKDVVAVGAVGYTLITKKLTAGFANPIFPSLQNTISLSQNSALLGFKFTF
jgi:hypothetical protein